MDSSLNVIQTSFDVTIKGLKQQRVMNVWLRWSNQIANKPSATPAADATA